MGRVSLLLSTGRPDTVMDRVVQVVVHIAVGGAVVISCYCSFSGSFTETRVNSNMAGLLNTDTDTDTHADT